MLVNLDESDPEGHTRVGAFREALGKLGWTEGRDIQIEFRSYAGSPERARSYAIELTALKPDVIFAAPSSALAALQRKKHVTCRLCLRRSATPPALDLLTV